MRLEKKIVVFTIAIAMGLACHAQIIFEDDFESYAKGDHLSEKEYGIAQSASYAGTLSATIDTVSGNKFVTLNAAVNGQARMQFLKEIELSPGISYTFELQTKGVFKRFLQLLPASGGEYLSKTPDGEIIPTGKTVTISCGSTKMPAETKLTTAIAAISITTP